MKLKDLDPTRLGFRLIDPEYAMELIPFLKIKNASLQMLEYEGEDFTLTITHGGWARSMNCILYCVSEKI